MKIRLLVSVLSLALFFFACKGKKEDLPDKPKILLSEEKMAEIISEVQLIEAYLNQIPYNKRGDNDSDYVYYPLLFEKYKISKDDFLENLVYYSQNEEAITSIYDQAIIILNKIKAKDLEIRLDMKLDSIRDDSLQQAFEQKVMDSLNSEEKIPNSPDE
ncbi:MAG: DUF4296 domain-containing protein [Bacteroidales bacterium]|nr:DUF4296 domain-containing protein [Bacteroidales bacterium]